MRAQLCVGRLLEVRAFTPINLEEIPALVATMKAIFERATGLVVAILDARSYGIEPPSAADQFVSVIKRDNPRIERSAFVIEPEQALLGLQLDRMIREANNPKRRLFRDVNDAVGFLAPVLTDEERARLDAFLAGAVEMAPLVSS